MMLALAVCVLVMGIVDYKERKVPLWLILITSGFAIGVSLSHPISSLFLLGIIWFWTRVLKLGLADQIILPVLCAALLIPGVFITAATLISSTIYARRKGNAPVLSFFSLYFTCLLGYQAITGVNIL